MEQYSNNRAEQKSLKRRFLLLLGVCFAIAYLVLGAMIIFMPEVFPALSPDKKKVLGGAIILYGAFRFYRLIKRENSEYD